MSRWSEWRIRATHTIRYAYLRILRRIECYATEFITWAREVQDRHEHAVKWHSFLVQWGYSDSALRYVELDRFLHDKGWSVESDMAVTSYLGYTLGLDSDKIPDYDILSSGWKGASLEKRQPRKLPEGARTTYVFPQDRHLVNPAFTSEEEAS